VHDRVLCVPALTPVQQTNRDRQGKNRRETLNCDECVGAKSISGLEFFCHRAVNSNITNRRTVSVGEVVSFEKYENFPRIGP
jgi:hypothetical protein